MNATIKEDAQAANPAGKGGEALDAPSGLPEARPRELPERSFPPLRWVLAVRGLRGRPTSPSTCGRSGGR